MYSFIAHNKTGLPLWVSDQGGFNTTQCTFLKHVEKEREMLSAEEIAALPKQCCHTCDKRGDYQLLRLQTQQVFHVMAECQASTRPYGFKVGEPVWTVAHNGSDCRFWKEKT